MSMRELVWMFDTVAAKFEQGPYFPKDASRNAWETRKHERFDAKLGSRVESVVHTLHLDQVRIAIMGDGGIVRFESSLPKLIYGNNVESVVAPVCHEEGLLMGVSQYSPTTVNVYLPGGKERP